MNQCSLYFSVAETTSQGRCTEPKQKELADYCHVGTDIEHKGDSGSKDEGSNEVSHLL